MSLKIDRGNKNSFKSEKRRYGNLIIETTVRNSNNVIDLNKPIHSLVNNVNNHKNTSCNTNYNNTMSTPITTNTNANSNFNNKVVNNTPSKNLSLKNSINSSSSVEMKRGQKISLTQICPNLSKLTIGLDWDVNSSVSSNFDLDTSIFMVNTNNITTDENFIFYNNPKSRCSGILLNGDHNSNLKTAFDETVQLNLNCIPPQIKTLAITVTIDDADIKNQSFRQVSNATFTIVDTCTKKELLNYKFNDNLSIETAIVVAEIYRHNDSWKLNTIGSGFRGGLSALCDNYGIETE